MLQAPVYGEGSQSWAKKGGGDGEGADADVDAFVGLRHLTTRRVISVLLPDSTPCMIFTNFLCLICNHSILTLI